MRAYVNTSRIQSSTLSPDPVLVAPVVAPDGDSAGRDLCEHPEKQDTEDAQPTHGDDAQPELLLDEADMPQDLEAEAPRYDYPGGNAAIMFTVGGPIKAIRESSISRRRSHGGE